MDLQNVAIIILDHEEKVLFSSVGARDTFRSFPGLAIEDGRWSGPLPREGEVFELDGDQPGSRLRMVRKWVSNGKPEIGYVGLLLCPLGTRPDVRRSRLMESFRFTPAELRLADLIIEGRRPQAAAAELGITVNTVRTYLKRLYRKVGVRSQSTLVCALNRALE